MPDIKGHEWVDKKFVGRMLTVCRKCGIVQRSDGMNSQCKGQVYTTRGVNGGQDKPTGE
ncbi:hypothetical protein [Rhizobium phage RHEph12]|nr:hypothetical protein [Rhizobium phage RHEph12]